MNIRIGMYTIDGKLCPELLMEFLHDLRDAIFAETNHYPVTSDWLVNRAGLLAYENGLIAAMNRAIELSGLFDYIERNQSPNEKNRR